MPLDRDDLLARIGNAFLSFLLLDFAEPDAPVLWSEGDCALRFAVALEVELPRRTHLALPLSASTTTDFDPVADRRQTADLVVADPDRGPLHHAAFVEVTHLPHGAKGGRVLRAIEADAARLQRHLELGRCTAALLLVVDESDLLEDAYPSLAHAAGVPMLLASPAAIVRRAYAVEHGVDLPLWCPACESPRLAAMRYVEEGVEPEVGDGWIDGGVAIWGDGRDARFGCRDCGFRGPRRRARREAASPRVAAADAAA